MPAQFTIADAVVKFSTSGDVTGPVQKQATAAERFEQQQAQSKMKWGDRYKAHQQRMNERVEQFRAQQERAEKHLQNTRNMNILKTAALAKTAFGSIPGVGAMADIAMAGAIGGPMGAAAMATGKAIGYGMEGAGKASPATMERFQYQQDRLQAIIGSHFIPAIEKMTKTLEFMGDRAGGKGAQLGYPQFSGFAEARDRMQMQAAAGMPEVKKGPFSSLIKMNIPGMMASGMNISSEIGGIMHNAWEDSWAQRKIRGIRDIFGG